MDIKFKRNSHQFSNKQESPENFQGPMETSPLKKIIILILIFAVFIIAVFYFFNRKVTFSHGSATIPQSFEVKPGERTQEIAKQLEQSNLIQNAYYFDYYIWKTSSKGKIQAGNYELSGSMTIPEIVQVLSIGVITSNEIKVTFPEGTRLEDMAAILEGKGFDGEGFLKIAKSRSGINADYEFLKNMPKNASLEGFLFPDTYIFKKDATPGQIVSIMLQDFDEKLTPTMRDQIKASSHNIFEIVTMASILEKEVKTSGDMKIVSGIFWKRVAVGGRLQSDATLEYILNNNDLHHSIADTNIDSPYNTYRNNSLPPGPINNPGLISINAAISPTASDYNYFLTDPATGKVVYAKTFDEHVANKNKYGL